MFTVWNNSKKTASGYRKPHAWKLTKYGVLRWAKVIFRFLSDIFQRRNATFTSRNWKANRWQRNQLFIRCFQHICKKNSVSQWWKGKTWTSDSSQEKWWGELIVAAYDSIKSHSSLLGLLKATLLVLYLMQYSKAQILGEQSKLERDQSIFCRCRGKITPTGKIFLLLNSLFS